MFSSGMVYAILAAAGFIGVAVAYVAVACVAVACVAVAYVVVACVAVACVAVAYVLCTVETDDHEGFPW